MNAETLAFLGIAALIVVTPGADMALVTKNGLAFGRRAALLTALGINLGVVVWTLAAALGVAALVRSSAVAFDALKYLGAAYLLYLGGQAIWRSFEADSHAPRSPRRRARDRAVFRQGLVSNLLNPKLAVFYTSLLPQFIDPSQSALVQSVVLGCLFNVLGIVWLCSYGWFIARVGDVLRPAFRRALDRITGAVLIGFGARLAAERA